MEMVDALCHGNDDPVLREQAVLIAENQLWLNRIKAEKVAVIERLRDAKAFGLVPDTSVVRARARARLSQVAVAQLKVLDHLIDKTTAAGADPEFEPVPPDLQAAWPPPGIQLMPEDGERQEYEALCEGIGELCRLQRYERRAWSRRRKAIRAYLAIRVDNCHRA
jgi:hypothetical protein